MKKIVLVIALFILLSGCITEKRSETKDSNVKIVIINDANEEIIIPSTDKNEQEVKDLNQELISDENNKKILDQNSKIAFPKTDKNAEIKVIDENKKIEPIIQPSKDENTGTKKITKLTEIDLIVPEIKDFKPTLYNYPKNLKFAFVEIEPKNNAGFDLNKERITPRFERFKFILESMFNGNIFVNPNYEILNKIVTDKIIDSNTYSNESFEEEIKQIPNLNEFGVLVIVVDYGEGVANHIENNSNSITIKLNSSHFAYYSDRDLTNFGYTLSHELLHDKKFGENKDAYGTGLYGSGAIGPFPWYNITQIGLYGFSRENYPIGPSLVRLGLKEYNQTILENGETKILNVKNSCLADSKINKIPLGYVLDSTKKLVAKSIVLEARADSVCPEIISPAGVYVHEIFESMKRVEFIHDIPFVHILDSNGKIIKITPDGNVFAKTYRGKNFAILNKIKNPFINEYTSNEFDIKLLDEEIVDGNLISSVMSFNLKQKENYLQPQELPNIHLNIFNYDNNYLLLESITDINKIPRFNILINDKEITSRPSKSKTIYCIVPIIEKSHQESCTKISQQLDKNINTKFVDLNYHTENKDICDLKISLNNNIAEKSVTIKNFLNPKCS